MSARVTWSGLEELKKALRNLPADLAGEASHIVEGAANGAATEIRTAYPVRTGKLRNSVTVTHAEAGRFGAAAVVKNTSKLAHIFEHGTQARHNSLGANRGSMPPGHVFIPVVIRKRRGMYRQLKDMLVRHGLIVSGEP